MPPRRAHDARRLCASAQAARSRGSSTDTPAVTGRVPGAGRSCIRRQRRASSAAARSSATATSSPPPTASTDNGAMPLPAGDFSVRLGEHRPRTHGEPFGLLRQARSTPATTPGPRQRRRAALTLRRPCPRRCEPLRLIEDGETSLWAPGKHGDADRLGRTTTLRTATRSDSCSRRTCRCVATRLRAGSAYGTDFHPATMVCAGDAGHARSDTCQGDSGGPLMVSDGAFLRARRRDLLGRSACATRASRASTPASAPSRSTSWVRDRVPMARASISIATAGASAAGDAVLGHHDAPRRPGASRTSPGTSTQDGVDDATGASPSHAYPAGGELRRRASTASGAERPDTRGCQGAVNVASRRRPSPRHRRPPIGRRRRPEADRPRAPRLADHPRRSVAEEPQVRRGRFKIAHQLRSDGARRHRGRSRSFRGKQEDRHRARPRPPRRHAAGERQADQGRQALLTKRQEAQGRLRVKIQVRVKRQVLRSKTLTIRL